MPRRSSACAASRAVDAEPGLPEAKPLADDPQNNVDNTMPTRKLARTPPGWPPPDVAKCTRPPVVRHSAHREDHCHSGHPQNAQDQRRRARDISRASGWGLCILVYNQPDRSNANAAATLVGTSNTVKNEWSRKALTTTKVCSRVSPIRPGPTVVEAVMLLDRISRQPFGGVFECLRSPQRRSPVRGPPPAYRCEGESFLCLVRRQRLLMAAMWRRQ